MAKEEKSKTIVVEITIFDKALEKLEQIAQHREASLQYYLTDVLHAKLEDMVDGRIDMHYSIKEWKEK